MGHEIAVAKGLPLGDFPDPQMMQQVLAPMDFSTFSPLDPKKLEAVEKMLTVDLPELLQLIPKEQEQEAAANVSQIAGRASPFAVMKVGGATEASVFQAQWCEAPIVAEYEAEFDQLLTKNPNGKEVGKISGKQAKEKMIESHLPSAVLHRIWALADVDKDGMLSLPEYVLAM